MVGQILSGQGTNPLADMLKALKKEKKDATDLAGLDASSLIDSNGISQMNNSVELVTSGQAVAASLDRSMLASASPSSVSSNSDSNMMSNNFVSKYGFSGGSVVDSLKGIKARKKIESQAKSRVSSLLDELGGIRVGDDVLKGTEGAIHSAKIKSKMKQLRKADTLDELEKVLKENKKHIEDKAQEAMQPKDENGKPIEALVTDGTPIGGVSAPAIDSGGSVPVIDSGASIDAGGSVPVLDSGGLAPVDVSVEVKSSSASQHIDIKV